MQKGINQLFNEHQDIIKIVEEDCYKIFQAAEGYDTTGEDYTEYTHIKDRLVGKVQQRLEYMQSQIDELMLEYCPDEISKEQFDNWAKNQVPCEYDLSGN